MLFSFGFYFGSFVDLYVIALKRCDLHFLFVGVHFHLWKLFMCYWSFGARLNLQSYEENSSHLHQKEEVVLVKVLMLLKVEMQELV